MMLLMISIPLMVLAVALAVLPLILMSCADHRSPMTETPSRKRWASAQTVAGVDEESGPMAA